MKINKDELRQARDFFSERFNQHSFNERHKMGVFTLVTQINQIMIEKGRLKRSYQRALKEVNDHLNNCSRDLIKEWKNETRDI